MAELWRAWRIRERRNSLRIARLTSLFANVHRRKGTETTSADDFCEIEELDDAAN
jgi:hypothetical protein